MTTTWTNSPARNESIEQRLNMHYKQVCDKYGAAKVWVTMLYGSQNYLLDTPDSDVDTKTMLIPDFKDVILGRKMVSTEMEMPDGSLSNVKDYRAMFQNYLKGNINFVETLYTPYCRVQPNFVKEFAVLRKNADLIANARPRKLMHMAAGMATQKFTAFEKPFASKLPVLEKYGYDPKQLHHLVRLFYFMEHYLHTMDFGESLNPERYLSCGSVYTLRELKTNPLPYQEAVDLNRDTMDAINELVAQGDRELPEEYFFEEASAFLDNLAVMIFEKASLREISNPLR